MEASIYNQSVCRNLVLKNHKTKLLIISDTSSNQSHKPGNHLNQEFLYIAT